MSNHMPAEIRTAPPETYGEALIDDLTFVAGDENGRLAINPDTFVDEYEQGVREHWTAWGFYQEKVEMQAQDGREQAEVALPWLTKWNGQLPNAYQSTNNILDDLDTGKPLRVDDLALAEHPDRDIRLFLAQNYPLNANTLKVILAFPDVSEEWASFLMSTQGRLIKDAYGDTRRGITLLSRLRRLSDKQRVA